MISREQIVEQSVEFKVRAILDAGGYTEVELVDGFTFGKGAKLDKTYVAAGFNFDTPPSSAEMGSDLVERVYTIEFFVFGETLMWARNVASVLKFGLQSDPNGVLPLYDLESRDVVDYLTDVTASSSRQPIPDPEPWQEYVFTVNLKATDTYFASQVV
jgi:hypothetical protein